MRNKIVDLFDTNTKFEGWKILVGMTENEQCIGVAMQEPCVDSHPFFLYTHVPVNDYRTAVRMIKNQVLTVLHRSDEITSLMWTLEKRNSVENCMCEYIPKIMNGHTKIIYSNLNCPLHSRIVG